MHMRKVTTDSLKPRLGWSFLTLVAGALMGQVSLPCHAADPPSGGQRSSLDPVGYYEQAQRHVAALRPPEILEMLWAIARGSQMGPGDGWFHPGQSRFGWDWLARRWDADANGTITAQELEGPAEIFERLDRNHDGVLTREDFDWSERSAFARQAGLAVPWFRLGDGNSNGRISREEWEALFARMAGAKGYLTPDDLREALTPPAPPRTAQEKRPEGPSPWTLLVGLFNGEIGSYREGPRVGQPAPEFTLSTHDGRERISLAHYRGSKPVVLIFGSFT
jgi:hypothetical protein